MTDREAMIARLLTASAADRGGSGPALRRRRRRGQKVDCEGQAVGRRHSPATRGVSRWPRLDDDRRGMRKVLYQLALAGRGDAGDDEDLGRLRRGPAADEGRRAKLSPTPAWNVRPALGRIPGRETKRPGPGTILPDRKINSTPPWEGGAYDPTEYARKNQAG